LTTHVSEVETRSVHWQTGNEGEKKSSANGKLFEQPNVSPVVSKGWLVGLLVMIELKEKYQRI
jgi:hypothetical protein